MPWRPVGPAIATPGAQTPLAPAQTTTGPHYTLTLLWLLACHIVYRNTEFL